MITSALIEIYKADQHLFFDQAVDLVVALASLGLACELQHTGKAQPYRLSQKLTIEGSASVSGMEMLFSPAKLLNDLIANKQPKSLRVTIRPISQSPPQHPINVSTLRRLSASLAATGFNNFYEKFARILKKKLGTDKNWPPSWRFAWLIRNALSHDGRIRFNDKSKSPVQWGGLHIGTSSPAVTVMFDTLTPVELFLLMRDMDRELKQVFSLNELFNA